MAKGTLFAAFKASGNRAMPKSDILLTLNPPAAVVKLFLERLLNSITRPWKPLAIGSGPVQSRLVMATLISTILDRGVRCNNN